MTTAEKKLKLQHVCGKWAYVARSINADNIQVVSAAIRCHSWFCPKCAKRKARKFAKAALAYFEGERLSFFTLTADPADTPRESVRLFATRWNILRTRIAENVKAFKYVRVLERQPGTGRAHYHIIVNRYIPHSLLQKEIKNAGFGKIYNIRKISGTDAFYYVLKYLKKEIVDSEFSQAVIDFKVRMISGSRGFRLLHADKTGWEVLIHLCDHDTALKVAKNYVWSIVDGNCSFIKYHGTADADYFEFKVPEVLSGADNSTVQYFISRAIENHEMNPFNYRTFEDFIVFLNRLKVEPAEVAKL